MTTIGRVLAGSRFFPIRSLAYHTTPERPIQTDSARFSGIGRLYGDRALERLATSHVCVIGIGGVGSWTVEALARTGVGTLTLVDLDDVCVHNTNRQLHTTTSAVGRPKVEVMAERVRAISPGCDVRPVADFFTASTAEDLLAPAYDHIVDAMDSANDKCRLIAHCWRVGRPVVTVGGVGGRRDPTRLTVGDLNKTARDRLLRRVRKVLRQRFEMPRTRGKWRIPCVYSTEDPVLPEGLAHCGGTLDCDTGYGTASYVSGTAGLVAAGVVVDQLLASVE